LSRVIIVGIDGLELSLIHRYIDELKYFQIFNTDGVLKNIDTVFPADSVPAWNTIFTGLNPAEHGIIRGKDYIENVKSFNDKMGFKLRGRTFWDEISKRGNKCLIVNPFLAYPAWEINGVMESGPAFVEGTPSFYPKNLKTLDTDCLGGYKPIKSLGRLKESIEEIFSDTRNLWDEFNYQFSNDDYALSFITFTTLDRIQHYTWRFIDKDDQLYKNANLYSDSIKKMLILFDSLIGELITKMKIGDKIILISDHGFGRRPYHLINLNEVLRKNGLLKLAGTTKSYEISNKSIHKIRNLAINYLKKIRILDQVMLLVKILPFLKKLKKSDYLIDKNMSLCYVDEYFNGKKPYCGINYGLGIKNGSEEKRNEVFEKILCLFNESNLPKPLWIKTNKDLYEGTYYNKYPDICFELPPEYGIEFDFFGREIVESVTHHRISGGHLGPGTFGYYSKTHEKKEIDSILSFAHFISELVQ
jgi:hypothetical protein